MEEQQEGDRQVLFLPEPPTASLENAKRVKCVVVSFETTTSKGSGKIKYGACIFTKGRRITNDIKTKNNGLQLLENPMAEHIEEDVFNADNIYATALKRYNKYPVEYFMDFVVRNKNITTSHLETKLNTKQKEYTTHVKTVQSVPDTRSEQVVRSIRQMLCDTVHGGCSSKHHTVEVKSRPFVYTLNVEKHRKRLINNNKNTATVTTKHVDQNVKYSVKHKSQQEKQQQKTKTIKTKANKTTNHQPTVTHLKDLRSTNNNSNSNSQVMATIVRGKTPKNTGEIVVMKYK